MTNISRGGAVARLRNLFRERELIYGGRDRVRYLRISPRMQLFAAAIATTLVLSWLLAMAGLVTSRFEREAAVAEQTRRIAEQRRDTARVAADLARRQAFIEQAIESELGPLNDGADPAAEPLKVSMGAADLAAIEQRQFAVVDRLTRLADARAIDAEASIRRLGLNPRLMLAKSRRAAQGGPLQGGAEDLGPRFAELGRSLARMDALRGALATVPHNLPASLQYISSGFGYRSDPFTGEAAMHAGLDFAGPYGAPIYAAADGRVSFAGIKNGYGNCLEITHGNGMMTRYGHMSAFKARIGQAVKAGDAIGAIGSTGRSTGAHLHFEVRINDQAVNPRPFLEAGKRIALAS